MFGWVWKKDDYIIFKLYLKSFLVAFLINIGCTKGNDSYLIQRSIMLEEQIKKRGIKDQAVVDAILEVKRHEFVPDNMKRLAYSDRPLPIGYDQTISQPYIVAYMTEHLDLKKHHKVLEIGTGSGYQAAVLSKIAKHVYTIEIVEPLAVNAKKVIEKNNYNNITVKIGDGYKGWEDHAPFDRIMVTAAPKKIPEKLVEQLKNGGKMIIPFGDNSLSQYLWIVEKDENGNIKKEKVLPVRFVPMITK